MKKSCCGVLSISIVCLISLLAGCRTQGTPTLQPVALTVTPTETITAAPTETATTQAIASASPQAEAIRIIPTSLEQPGKWSLQYPYSDPTAPQLIAKELNGYQLQADLQVASIELSYRWVGIGEGMHDYQRIERAGDRFWRDGTEIPTAVVEKLVQSIAHLKTEPWILTSVTHTDDYPFWAVELTDLDGNKVLLYSNSNSPGFVPWNVIYNGGIYAQFDGGIALALADLFEVPQGQTMASFWGPQEEGYLKTVTFEQPPEQLMRGFNGLLPIYENFYYLVDAQTGEVRVFLNLDKRSDKVGNAEVNWGNDLQAVQIELRDGKTVRCQLENEPVDYPESVYWRIVCPTGKPGADGTYQFPIHITFASSSGEPYILSGELFGYWEKSLDTRTILCPEEIVEILKSSPIAGDLLRDHVLTVINFYALADEKSGRMEHHWDANGVLLGQVQFGGRTIPYAVTIKQIVIEDGKLVHWELDRAELERLLQDVLTQNVTRRFVETDPNPRLNLYYIESGEKPLLDEEEIEGCVNFPAIEALPVPGKPLRGFSFNLSTRYFEVGYYNMQFLLLEKAAQVYQLELDTTPPQGVFWLSILPEELKPVDAPPFTAIFTSNDRPGISVMWDEAASEAEVSYYKAMFTGWETSALPSAAGLELGKKFLELTPDGYLKLVSCQAP